MGESDLPALRRCLHGEEQYVTFKRLLFPLGDDPSEATTLLANLGEGG